MFKNQKQLLEALVSEKVIEKTVADDIQMRALEKNEIVESLLLKNRIATEDQIVSVKSKLLNIPVADLKGRDIPKKVLNLVPREVAENYEMVPFERTGNELHIGLIDPQNFKAIEAIEFLSQKASIKARYFIISSASFHEALRQYRMLNEEAREALANIDTDVAVSKETGSISDMEEVIKSAPVSKMVLVIVRHAIDGRASDIHIEPTAADTKVRYRIDGILRTSLVLPKYIHSAIVGRIKVLANLKLDETRKPQDGRIRLTVEGRDIDFRVSTLPLFEGEKVVLRILDSDTSIPKLSELGINKRYITAINEIIKKPYGLLLLTGPTGSGKTTTLYTILTMLNQEGVNIVTLEDPIEYYINGVNQSQVNPEIGYSFADGLRSILRQDPNVVMVGEIRDKETTELVIHASLTGHMMLSTLHTNNSVGAIPRLIDLGAEPFLLSSVLNMVMAQRLARKICPDCKIEAEISPSMLDRVREQLATLPEVYIKDVDIKNLKFWRGTGCAHCGNLGYRGRTAVAEVIVVTPELREIVSSGGKVTDMMKALVKQDFITLTQDCLLRALEGETTIDEVIRVSSLN